MSNEPEQSYFAVTSGPVSYSNQIDDNVIADYEASGAVVGLEFLDSGVAKERDKFLALANRKSSGPMKFARPPENSTRPTTIHRGAPSLSR